MVMVLYMSHFERNSTNLPTPLDPFQKIDFELGCVPGRGGPVVHSDKIFYLAGAPWMRYGQNSLLKTRLIL